MQRSLLAAAVATATVAGLTGTVPAAHGAAPRPDLEVTKVSVDKTTVTEAARIKVTHTVANRGKAPAKASVSHFYLTTDVRRSLAERRASTTNPRSSLVDIRLQGERPVRAIKPGKSIGATAVSVVVPIGTPPGRYTVLACADDRGTVTESDERDNCKAAGQVTVKEAPGSDDLWIQQFADTARWPDDETGSLQWMKAFCPVAHPVKKLTLSAALTSAESFLKDNAGANALDRVAQSGQADTAEEAQNLAAAAVVGGSPGLALAALLRAHRLDPRSGDHLVNAAGVATAVGLPNQAIAFLDAAVGRNFLRPVAGIPQQAVSLVTRGQALMSTGRHALAKAAFQGARQLAPILSEADAGLASVAACEGDDQAAMRLARRSRVRSEDPNRPDNPEGPTPVLDTSKGQALALRQLPLPQTSDIGSVRHDEYDAIQDSLLDEIQERNQEQTDLEQHLRDTDADREPAEIDRRKGIMFLVYSVGDEGEVEDLREAVDAKVDELVEHKEAFWGGGTGEAPYLYNDFAEQASAACAGGGPTNCFEVQMNIRCRPALDDEHAEWRAMMQELQVLSDELLAEMSERMSGLAANLENPDAHRLVMLAIEDTENAIYSGLVGQAQGWTHYEKLFRDHCVEPKPIPEWPPPPSAPGASGMTCKQAFDKLSFKVKMGPTSVKINCEEIEQGFSTEIIPLINLYVDVKYEWRTGKMTVWAGVKGSVSDPLGVVDAGFKSGLYITADRNGDIADVGWKVGRSVEVTAGVIEWEADKDEVPFSFMPSQESARP